MKKAVFAFLLIGVATLGFAQTAVIKDLTGTVELKPSGSPDFIPASIGAEVAQDTIISTGFKSTALLQTGSAVITVRPITRLTLTEIQASQGTENLNLSLQAGRVRVDVNPPAGSKASVGIASPTATASVRGTSFELDARNLRVYSGTVAFVGKWGYQINVQEGHAAAVGASGTAVPTQSGVGYEAGPTGGTGVISSGKKEPIPPTGGGSSGGGGGGGGDRGGGVEVGVEYP